MITLFLSPSCTSCRKARAWLKKHDVPFKEHNIMTSPLSKQELTSILALTENGTDDIISTRSKIFQKLDVDVDFKGHTYRGMASVGKNITFDGKELRFEVNLFDFSGDIYGHTLTVHWLDKIREMIKFDSIPQLVAQLEEDEVVARKWTKD